MYTNPYMNYQQGFNQQSMNERIDNQIAQLQQMKDQMKNNQQQPIPTNLTQNFQLAPTHQGGIRYANSLDDVNREMVYIDTPFFSKDMSVVWVKNNKDEVKSYELKEILPMDSKDMQIQYLQSQIEELKGMMKNESVTTITNDDEKQSTTNTQTNDDTMGTTTKKSKPTVISKVSGSKEK